MRLCKAEAAAAASSIAADSPPRLLPAARDRGQRSAAAAAAVAAALWVALDSRFRAQLLAIFIYLSLYHNSHSLQDDDTRAICSLLALH